MENFENRILRALQDIINTGNDIKINQVYNPNYLEYVIYVKSVKKYIEENTHEIYLLQCVEKFPINKIKPYALSFPGPPFGSSGNKMIDSTIDEFIFLSNKMISYIQYPGLRNELLSP